MSLFEQSLGKLLFSYDLDGLLECLLDLPLVEHLIVPHRQVRIIVLIQLMLGRAQTEDLLNLAVDNDIDSIRFVHVRKEIGRAILGKELLEPLYDMLLEELHIVLDFTRVLLRLSVIFNLLEQLLNVWGKASLDPFEISAHLFVILLLGLGILLLLVIEDVLIDLRENLDEVH